MQDKVDTNTGQTTAGKSRQGQERMGDAASGGAAASAGKGAYSDTSMSMPNSTGSDLGEQARETLSSVGTTVASRLNAQKERTAEGLQGLARSLRQSCQQLREQDANLPIESYVSSAADQAERLSGYLRSHDVSEMVDGVERLAREQPALFIGGAFMLGLLGARFLKSSGRHGASRDLTRHRGMTSGGGGSTSGGSPYGGQYMGAPPLRGPQSGARSGVGQARSSAGAQTSSTAYSGATTSQGHSSGAQPAGSAPAPASTSSSGAGGSSSAAGDFKPAGTSGRSGERP